MRHGAGAHATRVRQQPRAGGARLSVPSRSEGGATGSILRDTARTQIERLLRSTPKQTPVTGHTHAPTQASTRPQNLRPKKNGSLTRDASDHLLLGKCRARPGVRQRTQVASPRLRFPFLLQAPQSARCPQGSIIVSPCSRNIRHTRRAVLPRPRSSWLASAAITACCCCSFGRSSHPRSSDVWDQLLLLEHHRDDTVARRAVWPRLMDRLIQFPAEDPG